MALSTIETHWISMHLTFCHFDDLYYISGTSTFLIIQLTTQISLCNALLLILFVAIFHFALVYVCVFGNDIYDLEHVLL